MTFFYTGGAPVKVGCELFLSFGIGALEPGDMLLARYSLLTMGPIFQVPLLLLLQVAVVEVVVCVMGVRFNCGCAPA